MAQSGIDRFMELAEEGREKAGDMKGIGFTPEDTKDYKAIKRHKALKTIFAAAAAGASATLGYYVVTEPQTIIDAFVPNAATPVEDFSLWGKAYLFVTLSMLSSALSSPLWTRADRKINEKLGNIWNRQKERAEATELKKLERAEQKFMQSLAFKSSADLTQADYDTIVLSSKPAKRMTTDAVLYRRILDSEMHMNGHSFAGKIRSKFPQNEAPRIHDAGNSIWMLPALFTFTAPLLTFISLAATKLPTLESMERQEPVTPDLAKLKSDIMQDVIAESRAKSLVRAPN